MIKTVDEYVKIFKDMISGEEVSELHIQVGEHVIHLHNYDTGFNVLYNRLKDLEVELTRFSQLDRGFDLCFKYIGELK